MSNPTEQGLSLLDLQPQIELVPIGDKKLTVIGVSAEGVFALFARFPEMATWVAAGKVSIPTLVQKAPQAIKAIIAAGCGAPGNEAAEEVAALLPVESQMDVIEAIARLTFKNGFGPFVSRIMSVAAQVRSANDGKVQATTSPPTSKPSPPTGTDPIPSGS